MAMFDPIYVTEVLNDILGRRGLELILTPKETEGSSDDAPVSHADPEGADRVPARQAGGGAGKKPPPALRA